MEADPDPSSSTAIQIQVRSSTAAQDVRELESLLVRQPELRGRVSPVEAPPDGETLGPWIDTLAAVLVPGGAASALSYVLVTWIKNRGKSVEVKVELPSGEKWTATGEHLSGKNVDEIYRISEELARRVEGRDA